MDTSITVNPESDGQLDSLANWKLWTATYAGDRYPVIPVEMARPETPLSAPGPDIGDMVQVTGTPSWLEPGPISQLQAGTSETLTPFTWGIGVNAIPETPYEVAVAGVAHADTDGSQLASSYSSSATSLSVEQSAGSTSLWTTSGGDFPFSHPGGRRGDDRHEHHRLLVAADVHRNQVRQRRGQGPGGWRCRGAVQRARSGPLGGGS